jgi:NADH dehydrogenase FAD-containing subunit
MSSPNDQSKTQQRHIVIVGGGAAGMVYKTSFN